MVPSREEFAVGLEAVGDALGVIEPVHAQQDGFRVAQVLADLLGPGDDVGADGEFLNFGDVDGDGEGCGAGNVD